MTSKQRCLAAIRGEAVDRVPVFPLLMFFAQERHGISYREFATNGQALAEAQLRMRDRFPIDAITVCSDAFRLTADLGAEMVFPEDNPPFAAQPLVRSRADLQRLSVPDPTVAGSRMGDRLAAISAMARVAGDDCLVLGWVDMPFAEACSLCGISEFMMLLVDDPELAHEILGFLTEAVIDFAVAQHEAGAPMVGAGDAAASLLSPNLYRTFALPYEQRVVRAVHNVGGLVKLHICGNTTHLLTDLAASGADLFNVDHLVDFETACEDYGRQGHCFKGNLDPVADIMQVTPEQCLASCQACLQAAQGLPYMLSAGCEIPASTPDAVFEAFCQSPTTVACP